MADEATKNVNEEVAEELDILEPRTETKAWQFSDGEVHKTYTQKPLGFFHKVEFFSLLGDTVDQMSESGRPLDINGILGSGADMDSLVAIVSRVASHAPDALKEAYCIALAVPRGEREWAKWVMEEQLTDEEGFDLMERFVEQNGDAMKDFFTGKGTKLIKRASQKFSPKRDASAPAPSSKPSKRTRQATAA